jgi:hypothetical protein
MTQWTQCVCEVPAAVPRKNANLALSPAPGNIVQLNAPFHAPSRPLNVQTLINDKDLLLLLIPGTDVKNRKQRRHDV